MSERFVQLAREGYEAAARDDFAVLSDLLDPDVQWHGGDPTDPGSCHNRQEALEFMRQARGRGGIGELVEVVDAGDQVVVILRPLGRAEDRLDLSPTSAPFATARSSRWSITPIPTLPWLRPAYCEQGVRIEVLYFEGCPGHERLMPRLRALSRCPGGRGLGQRSSR